MATQKVIVKVQVAQFPANADMLIYSEDRSIMDNVPYSKLFADKALKGQPKGFFYAKIDTKKQGYWLTNEPAPWQEW